MKKFVLNTCLLASLSIASQNNVDNAGAEFSSLVRSKLQSDVKKNLENYNKITISERFTRLAIEMILESLRLQEMSNTNKGIISDFALNAGEEMFKTLIANNIPYQNTKTLQKNLDDTDNKPTKRKSLLKKSKFTGQQQPTGSFNSESKIKFKEDTSIRHYVYGDHEGGHENNDSKEYNDFSNKLTDEISDKSQTHQTKKVINRIFKTQEDQLNEISIHESPISFSQNQTLSENEKTKELSTNIVKGQVLNNTFNAYNNIELNHFHIENTLFFNPKYLDNITKNKKLKIEEADIPQCLSIYGEKTYYFDKEKAKENNFNSIAKIDQEYLIPKSALESFETNPSNPPSASAKLYFDEMFDKIKPMNILIGLYAQIMNIGTKWKEFYNDPEKFYGIPSNDENFELCALTISGAIEKIVDIINKDIKVNVSTSNAFYIFKIINSIYGNELGKRINENVRNHFNSIDFKVLEQIIKIFIFDKENFNMGSFVEYMFQFLAAFIYNIDIEKTNIAYLYKPILDLLNSDENIGKIRYSNSIDLNIVELQKQFMYKAVKILEIHSSGGKKIASPSIEKFKELKNAYKNIFN